MCSLAFSLWIYFTYYRIQKRTNENYPLEKSLFLIPSKFMRTIPSAGYSLLIIPMNLVYKKLAIFMTDFGKNEEMRKFENRGVPTMGVPPPPSSGVLYF
jgi:hypothetical protein